MYEISPIIRLDQILTTKPSLDKPGSQKTHMITDMTKEKHKQFINKQENSTCVNNNYS